MTTSPAKGLPVWFGPLMVFIGGCCIGLSPIGMRYGLDALGPQAIALWRFLLALPFLFLLIVMIEKRLPVRPNMFVVIGGICFGLYVGFWHWALTITTVANATFIIGLGNLGAGLTAWVFLKDRLTPAWMLSVMVALFGAAALSLGGGSDTKAVLRGDLLAVIAAVMISFYVVASKVARRDLGGLDTIFWLTFFEALVAIPLVLAFNEAWLPADLSGFAAPLFLAIFIQVIGQGLIILGLGHTSAGIAGILVVVQPVVAAAVSWPLFNEPLAALQVVGAILILIGMVISQRGGDNPGGRPTRAEG